MMEVEKFRDEVIEVTQRAVDRKPEEWITFNDTLNTKIIRDCKFQSKIKLNVDELPILECSLDGAYLLVTTDRIVSVMENYYDEVYFECMDRFLNEFEEDNYKKIDDRYPKIHKIAIRKKDGSKLFYLIDSYYPSAFAKILIQNLSSYKSYGRWFLNPDRKN